LLFLAGLDAAERGLLDSTNIAITDDILDRFQAVLENRNLPGT
jgi:hypothetical protein